MAKKVQKKLPALDVKRSIERQYQKDLRAVVRRVKDIMKRTVFPQIPSLIEEYQALFPNEDSVNLDQNNTGDKISELFNAVTLDVETQIPDRELERIAEENADAIAQGNKEKIMETFRRGLGIDPITSEPWLRQVIQTHVKENVALIKTMNREFLAESERVVFNGVRRGLRQEEISKKLLEGGKVETGRFKKAKNRANLIARDQAAKLNGQLTKLRQEEVGVQEYFWETVGDSRVRDHHANLQGRKFKWSKGAPPSRGVGIIHPGEEVNCRCWARPNLEPLLN